MSVQPNDALVALGQIATEAGRKILPFFQKSFAHRLKADSSPVTDADLAAHEHLVKALNQLNPRRVVISEESTASHALSDSITEEYWLIDPLDGTKEFMKGKREFTVNVALIRDGKSVLGVVHAPALGVTYLAQAGEGAWRQVSEDPHVPIRARSAVVQHLTVVASKDHSGPQVKRLLAKLNCPQVTSIGSSLKLCLVAEGRADLYFRDIPTMEWDTAAAQCVVEAAGGRVLTVDGEPLGYGKPTLKNPSFIVLGDPNFNWRELAPGESEIDAFRGLFAKVSNMA